MIVRYYHLSGDEIDSYPTFKGTEVFPLGERKFTDDIDGEELFYRRKMSGKLLFINRHDEEVSSNDFDHFIELENNPIKRCINQYIVTETTCEKLTTNYHIGKFSFNDCEFDLDKCTIQLKTETVDEYTCILEKKSEEFNALTVSPIETVKSQRFVPYVFLVCRDDCTGIPCGVPDPAYWDLFYEYCEDYVPGTNVFLNETNTDYETVGLNWQKHGMYFDGVDNFVYCSISEQLGIGWDIKISKFNTVTKSETVLKSWNDNDLIGFAAGQETYAVIEDVSGVVRVRRYDVATNTLQSDYAVPFFNTFKKITCAYQRWALLYFDGGSDRVVINGSVISTGSNMQGASFTQSETAVAWFQDNNTVRIYRYSDATMYTVDTGVTSVNDFQLNDNWLVYRNNLNELVKVEISTLTKTVVTAGIVNEVYLGQTLVAYDTNTNALYIHDMVNGGADTLVISSQDGDGVILNDLYCTYQVSNDLYVYDIVGATATLVESNANINNNELIIDGDWLYYKNRTLFEVKNWNLVNESAGAMAKSYQNVPTYWVIGNEILGFQGFSTGASTVGDVYWFYTKQIDNNNKVKIWFQEQVTTVCLGGIPNEPSGAGFVLESDNCSTNSTALWKRKPTISPSQVGTVLTTDCGTDPTTNTNPVILLDDCAVPTDKAYWLELKDDITYDRGRSLFDVIEEMVATFCPELSGVRSDFFDHNSNTPNNSLANYVTGEAHEFDKLVLFQKSDFINPNSTEAATKGIITFDQIFDWFKILFDVYWFVDENYLRFEHSSFKNKGVGLDLTQGVYRERTIHKNKYSYEKESIPKQEVFKATEQNNFDFTGYPIEYKNADGSLSLCASNEIKDRFLSRLTLDVFFIQTDPSKIDYDGFVLLACEEINGDLFISNKVGVLSGLNYPNTPLSWANLHDK
ncbi:MAG: hypothetical protein KC589_09180, partial [Nanoarchaeota archaeon]|nr:hypothetical protein [Nanoarchaeota archaeon]